MTFTIGSTFFNAAGGAIDDLYQAKAYGVQAKTYGVQAEDYVRAARESDKSALYAQTDLQLKEYQTDRQNFLEFGQLQSDLGGAGFAQSGTALYLAMDAARQGALAKANVTQQGQIAIEGYEEQAASYRSQAVAAQLAAYQARKSKKGSVLGSIIKGGLAIASLF